MPKPLNHFMCKQITPCASLTSEQYNTHDRQAAHKGNQGCSTSAYRSHDRGSRCHVIALAQTQTRKWTPFTDPRMFTSCDPTSIMSWRLRTPDRGNGRHLSTWVYIMGSIYVNCTENCEAEPYVLIKPNVDNIKLLPIYTSKVRCWRICGFHS